VKRRGHSPPWAAEQEKIINNAHTKILLDFNAKVVKQNILNPIIGNECLHQDSNDIGVRMANFAT
jgi:hypothetical protein